ncbi:hypothetical protein, partial [Acinetobacter baumannii]|uniref:hypothetical protein n=1 Tax=Acinetobacter baumannii TaxID=470 RepID=UPI001C08DFE0
ELAFHETCCSSPYIGIEVARGRRPENPQGQIDFRRGGLSLGLTLLDHVEERIIILTKRVPPKMSIERHAPAHG